MFKIGSESDNEKLDLCHVSDGTIIDFRYIKSLERIITKLSDEIYTIKNSIKDGAYSAR